MRVLTYVLTSLIVVVTSFNIISVDNSVDNPRHQRMKKLLDELHQLQSEFEHSYEPIEEDDSVEDTDKRINSDLAFEISPHAINYFWHQMMASIRHDALRQSTISFQTSYLEFDVRVDAIQIVQFHPPTIHMRSTKDQIQIRTEGGHAKLLGLYYGKYRTIREGQLEAVIEDLHINIDINRDEDGKLSANERECSHTLGSVDITLSPILPSQIADTIRDEIITRVAKRICPAVVSFANRIIKTTQTSLILQRAFPKIAESIHYKFTHSEASDQSVLIYHDNPDSNSVLRLPNKPSAMSTVAISETFVNNYLNELNEKGNIIFQINRIEQIKNILRLSCEEEEVCVGNVIKMPRAIDGTGHLEAKCLDAPIVTFTENNAHVEMNLHFELSYQQDDSENRQVYLSFHAPISLKVKNVELIPLPEGKYQWKADYSIEEIRFGKIRQSDIHVSNIQKVLEEFTEEHIEDIESLLSTYLGGNLPLFSNHNIHIKQHGHSQFSNGQMILQADFKVSRALFPVFDFLF